MPATFSLMQATYRYALVRLLRKFLTTSSSLEWKMEWNGKRNGIENGTENGMENDEELVMQNLHREPHSSVMVRRFRKLKSCCYVIAIPSGWHPCPNPNCNARF